MSTGSNQAPAAEGIKGCLGCKIVGTTSLTLAGVYMVYTANRFPATDRRSRLFFQVASIGACIVRLAMLSGSKRNGRFFWPGDRASKSRIRTSNGASCTALHVYASLLFWGNGARNCETLFKKTVKNMASGEPDQKKPKVADALQKPNYAAVQAMAASLLHRVGGFQPTIGIICGSGLGGLADNVQNPQIIEYSSIDGFPASTVHGHAGRLVFGTLGGHLVVCMQGRFHPYEGYPAWKVTLPVRVMRLLGVQTLLVTNACGGLNPAYNVGDLMIIKDHINFTGMAGNNPLVGPNDEEFGPRFPPMNHAYSKEFRAIALAEAHAMGISQWVRQGVYACVSGPSFETPAEATMLLRGGADVVGMSTAPEVVIAKHCGMQVLGISLVTNNVVMDVESSSEASHEEVLETGRMRSKTMQDWVVRILAQMAPQGAVDAPAQH